MTSLKNEEQMNWTQICGAGLLAFALVAAACTGSPGDKRSPKKGNNVVVNNSTTGGSCGNDALDPGEACDSGIASGDGVCPNSCPTPPDTCGTFELAGSADDCTARCELVPAACAAGDGCCPTGCDSTTDDDCSNTCGDGVVEGPEICDGDCPTTCEDGNSCTVGTLNGSPTTCSATCSIELVAACADGDGCCPAGCDAGSDSDCSDSCGNGVIDDGESCDGDCPASCDDSNICTSDDLIGLASNCSASCVFSQITTCSTGDGCCPAGCTSQTDTDCMCAPTTSCPALGYTCGSLFNGCADVSCGTCNQGQTCMNNVCLDTFGIGEACNAASCTACIEESTSGWDGGYCSRGCRSNSDCGATSHCGLIDADTGDGGCLLDCTTNADCPRSGYECFDFDANGSRECAPTGAGNSATGGACDTIGDCSGGQGAACVLSSSVINGGYCVNSCTTGAQCGGGAHCSSPWGVCLDSCVVDADCRGTGYGCYDADEDGTKECWHSATGSGDVGDACDEVWDCAGGQYGFCLDEAGTNIPGGYCVITCGPNGGTCPQNSACILPDGAGDEFCMQTCISSGDCRGGYSCISAGIPTDEVCWL